MTEYSRMAKGFYDVIGSAPPRAKIINLPFRPDVVELYNFTAASTPAQNGVPYAYWDVNMGQGTALIEAFNATPVLTTDNVAVGGISTFAAGQLLQYGAVQQVVSITKADPAVVEVTAHGLTSGDVVVFQGLYSTQFTAGMPQIDGLPFTVTVTDANHFTIPWNTNQSEYTALAASPSGASVKKVLYPYLYFPGVSFITSIDLDTPTGFTTISTTSAHNFVVGQEVAIRIPRVNDPSLSPPAWGTIELNSLPNSITPGSPIYYYVVAVTDYNTVILKVNSAGFTTFNSNIPVADVPGLSFPQIVAVGDVNTGGELITSTSPLYPPPHTLPIGTTSFVDTINGPAIRGAFVNNTSQGFVIGAGAGVTLTSAYIGGTAEDRIFWRAYLHDMSIPY